MASKVILTDSSKWEEWDRAFKAYLKGIDLIGFLLGTEKAPSKPPVPEPKDFLTSQQREAILISPSQQSDETVETASLPLPRQIEENDLNVTQMKWYTEALTRYKLKYDVYDRHRRNYDDIRKWMRETVKHEYAISALDDDVEIPKMYANLKRLAGTSDADIQAKIYEAYKTHLAPRSKPPNVDKWADEWELIMERASRHKLPIATVVWVNDLISLWEKHLPNWASSFRMTRREAINTGTISYRLLSTDLREAGRSISKHQKLAGKVVRGAFPAIHEEDNKPLLEDGPPTNDEGDNNESKDRRSSRKRKPIKPQDARPNRCEACGDRYHIWRQCFYLFPELAYEDWKGSNFAKKKAEKKLKEDEEFAVLVDALKQDRKRKSNN